MARVTSHILDSLSGVSASGIRVALFRLDHQGRREPIFEIVADSEGRIDESVDLSDHTRSGEYELEFDSAGYFFEQARSLENKPLVKTVVIRFSMHDDSKRYHLPLMLSPYSYSVWSSG